MNDFNFPFIPEVSVILATYNRAEYLTGCIQSVLNQTYQDWEFIIVDDGSQDHTFEIVNPYLKNFSKIRYLKHKNKGAALSRNAGIKASFGRYITFIDSDDQYLFNHLQSRLDFFQTHPEIELIVGGFKANEETWVTDYYNPDQKVNIQNCVICPTLFGKRYVFFELQGFQDILYGEDTDLWERAGKKFKIQKIVEPLTYLYTRAADSVSRQFSHDF
ncbi:MAG: glycosyltransferase family 2 protein [cyanobacterium endosymbiont of Rhopalodia musculus]|uniref:glycosyltransferase family 2 protein n=1 Tax=cyanobacterium endosymbiont of Epithemia clementina EcSB TaxID=3034674 RepID=UPI00247FC232|nr:glycosyltransferase family 2 protein [cyanobacterium endosymbiont of Epithemia clementina EcSB]WGT67381.1 glycosyltransferase family 2 protein [cyanobacterium endosymbiont of Epithemia clementina EcSB]